MLRYIGLLLIILIYLPCCSTPFVMDKGEFNPFFSSFYKEGSKRGADVYETFHVQISFANLDESDDVGRCSTFASGANTIQINQEFWKWASYPDKEQLIYHELGHCVLGVDHVQSPTEIMYSSMIDEQFYIENRKELLDHLFGSTND